jgi:hypothetical protein
MAFTKINAAGIGTTETVTVDGLTVINNESIGGNLTVTGNATISGVLTYEDVTNVDSVGLITARNGVVVGSGITLSKDGDIFATGVTTSTTFSGNFSGGTVSGTTGTFSSDVKSTAGIVDIRSGSSINTNVTGASASGTLQKNTTSGEFAIVSGGTGGNNYLNFYTSASAAPTAKLRITHEGKIGITESSPANYGIHASQSSESVYYRADSGSVDSIFGSATSLGYSIAGTTSNHPFVLFANNAERARISTSGQVRINTAGAPSADLHVGGSGGVLNALFQTSRSSGAYHKYALGASGADLGYIGSAQQISSSGAAAGFAFRSEDHIEFCSGGSTERIRIDSSGRFLHGHAASRTVGTKTGQLQVINSGNNASISIIQTNNAASAPFLAFGKTRSANTTGSTIVQNGDSLGQILFAGADGSDVDSTGALITAKVDGTPGSNDMPGKLVFATTADGASTATPRMEISSVGIVTCRNVPSFLIAITAGLNSVGSSPIIMSEDNGFTLSATGRNAHNVGSHFNEADGKFTAPVEGLYFFGYSIMRLSTSGSGAVDIRIMKNGSYQSFYSRNYQGAYTANFQAEGNTTIARLKKNDYVQFRVGANMSIHDDDSYFYGFLVG